MTTRLEHAELITILATGVVTVDGNGGAIEIRRFSEACKFLLSALENAGAAPTITVTIEHADLSAGPFTDSGQGFAVISTANSEQMIGLDIDELKPWVRAKYVLTGAGADYTIAVLLVARKKQ